MWKLQMSAISWVGETVRLTFRFCFRLQMLRHKHNYFKTKVSDEFSLIFFCFVIAELESFLHQIRTTRKYNVDLTYFMN